MTTAAPRWLTRAEAAERARCSVDTIDRWAKLAKIKAGSRVDLELLDAYLENGRAGVNRVLRERKRAA